MPGEPKLFVIVDFVTGRGRCRVRALLVYPESRRGARQKLNPWHSSIGIFAEVMLGQ